MPLLSGFTETILRTSKNIQILEKICLHLPII